MKKLILLTAIVLSSLLAKPVQAQELTLKADTTYFTLQHQYATGSPHLTGNQKTELHRIFSEKIQERFPDVTDTKKLSFYILGMTNPENWSEACKSNNRWGDNANYPHAITSKASLEDCANVNEIALGRMRSEIGSSFAIEQGWVDPLRVHTGVYGAVDAFSDSPTRKTLLIAVIRHNNATLAEMPEIKTINQRAERQDTDINNVIVGLNANTDQTNQNSDAIDDLDRRVTTLEKDRLVSGHIGIGGEYFASELAPTAEIGLSAGQFQFSGWVGYLPNAGIADLKEGPTDYTRSSVGWSITWYALSYEQLRFGPTIGYQFARDDIDAANCEIVYQSPLLGASVDIALNDRFSLYGNASYAPVSAQITGDLHTEVSTVQGRIGLRLNF